MMQGIIGKKVGMTRIFDQESGRVVPITVVATGGNTILQVKTVEKDGYSAVQLGFDTAKEKSFNKPQLGQFKKYGSEPKRAIKEFQLDSDEEALEAGQNVDLSLLQDVGYVDVTGDIKGRGFAGTVKKYNFRIGRATHGNTNRRDRGSLGAGTYPARVFPGLKMAGQYGNTTKTIKGVQIVDVNLEEGLLYLKGAIPGKNRGVVYIKKNLNK